MYRFLWLPGVASPPGRVYSEEFCAAAVRGHTPGLVLSRDTEGSL